MFFFEILAHRYWERVLAFGTSRRVYLPLTYLTLFVLPEHEICCVALSVNLLSLLPVFKSTRTLGSFGIQPCGMAVFRRLLQSYIPYSLMTNHSTYKYWIKLMLSCSFTLSKRFWCMETHLDPPRRLASVNRVNHSVEIQLWNLKLTLSFILCHHQHRKQTLSVLSSFCIYCVNLLVRYLQQSTHPSDLLLQIGFSSNGHPTTEKEQAFNTLIFTSSCNKLADGVACFFQ